MIGDDDSIEVARLKAQHEDELRKYKVDHEQKRTELILGAVAIVCLIIYLAINFAGDKGDDPYGDDHVECSYFERCN